MFEAINCEGFSVGGVAVCEGLPEQTPLSVRSTEACRGCAEPTPSTKIDRVRGSKGMGSISIACDSIWFLGGVQGEVLLPSSVLWL
jgi:hypothetical protein